MMKGSQRTSHKGQIRNRDNTLLHLQPGSGLLVKKVRSASLSEDTLAYPFPYDVQLDRTIPEPSIALHAPNSNQPVLARRPGLSWGRTRDSGRSRQRGGNRRRPQSNSLHGRSRQRFARLSLSPERLHQRWWSWFVLLPVLTDSCSTLLACTAVEPLRVLVNEMASILSASDLSPF